MIDQRRPWMKPKLLPWRAPNLHEADAAGQEVHEEGEERRHVVDLRGLGDAAQGFQRGHDLPLDRLLLADLRKVLLVDEVEEALLQRVEHLEVRRGHTHKLELMPLNEGILQFFGIIFVKIFHSMKRN